MMKLANFFIFISLLSCYDAFNTRHLVNRKIRDVKSNLLSSFPPIEINNVPTSKISQLQKYMVNITSTMKKSVITTLLAIQLFFKNKFELLFKKISYAKPLNSKKLSLAGLKQILKSKEIEDAKTYIKTRVQELDASKNLKFIAPKTEGFYLGSSGNYYSSEEKPKTFADIGSLQISSPEALDEQR